VKPLIFLKLGGSLITDKETPETPRPEVLERIGREIASALDGSFRLLAGHGSGSFGHVVGREYGVRSGVSGPRGWYGFAATARAAARLNRLVTDALWEAGVPALSVQPSASARCRDGEILSLSTGLLKRALDEGLVPLVYGDVALDEVRGGTIISTEEIFAWLARRFEPAWILLAGETAGVLDRHGQVVPKITHETWQEVSSHVAGSRGVDVTGGMQSKVETMLALVREVPGLQVRIFSGIEPGNVLRLLRSPEEPIGTLIVA
jgi:isopentenyl phosphate kinase